MSEGCSTSSREHEARARDRRSNQVRDDLELRCQPNRCSGTHRYTNRTWDLEHRARELKDGVGSGECGRRRRSEFGGRRRRCRRHQRRRGRRRFDDHRRRLMERIRPQIAPTGCSRTRFMLSRSSQAEIVRARRADAPARSRSEGRRRRRRTAGRRRSRGHCHPLLAASCY